MILKLYYNVIVGLNIYICMFTKIVKNRLPNLSDILKNHIFPIMDINIYIYIYIYNWKYMILLKYIYIYIYIYLFILMRLKLKN